MVLIIIYKGKKIMKLGIKKIFILLLCVSMLISFRGYAYAHDDDNHMGSAIVWIPVMAGVMYLAHYLFFRDEKHDNVESDRALEILKERYSRGEITREEYLRMKKDIEE